MELFASPMACSLASHIAIVEAGLPVQVRFVENKKTDDGGDFFAVSSYGYVPALRLDNGQVLNEGASVLQYLADRRPEAGLAPPWGSAERYQLIDVLHYLGTEVHKKVFYNILSPAASAEAREAAKAQLAPTLGALARRLGGKQVLVGNSFTVADAYLLTLLNWAVFLKADLAQWPVLQVYHQLHLKRPSVVTAMGIEMAERQRRAA